MKASVLPILLTLSGLCLAAPTPDGPFVYTIGTAALSAKADTAVLPLRLTERNEDVTAAMRSINQKTERLFALLAEEKIDVGDITAHEIAVTQEMDPGKPRVVGFRVSRGFTVTSRDLQRFGSLIDQLTQISAIELSAANFRHADSTKLKEQCAELAMDDARKQAERLAAKAGAKVGPVHAIAPISFGDLHDTFLQRSTEVDRSYYQRAQEPSPPKANFVIPDVHQSASVHVVFTLAAD